MESAWSQHGVMVYEACCSGGALVMVWWRKRLVSAFRPLRVAEELFAFSRLLCSIWPEKSRREIRRCARLIVTNFRDVFYVCSSHF